MQNRHYNRQWSFVIGFILSLLLPLTAFAETVGYFSLVEGRVDILKVGKTSAVPVKKNDNVSMGDIVRTKSDGRTEITFKDETTVKLAPETRMKIDEYTFNPDNSRNKGVLNLFRGKVRSIVTKSKGIIPIGLGISSFNVNTPTAIAGVRGTDFFVFFDKGITGVIFKVGQGFVINPNMPDKIININAGQITFVINPNVLPAPPRPATKVEMTQHAKDTAPAEKPKEKKEEKAEKEPSKTVEAKAEKKEEEKEKKEEKIEEGKPAEEVKAEEVKKEEAKTETGKVKAGEKIPTEEAPKTVAAPVKAETAEAAAPVDIAAAPAAVTGIETIPITDVISVVDVTGAAGLLDISGGTIPLTTTGGEVVGITGGIPVTDIITPTTGTADTSTLIPVTETYPELMTKVKVNLVFP